MDTISQADEVHPADYFLLMVDGLLLGQHRYVLFVQQTRVVVLRLLLVVVVLVVVAVVHLLRLLALNYMFWGQFRLAALNELQVLPGLSHGTTYAFAGATNRVLFRFFGGP